MGQETSCYLGDSSSSLRMICSFDPEDNNEMQIFPICASESAEKSRFLKIEFNASTDFYGRVTIYRLEVYGDDMQS